MLRTYAELTKPERDRAGQTWMECDAEDCAAAVRIDNIARPGECPSCGEAADGRFCGHCGSPLAPAMPDGWATSNPDDDPTQGAAQFCPKHADAIPAAPAAELPAISDTNDPQG